jgi:hypothetical protein
MAYNKDLDKVLWSKNIEDEEGKQLVVSVYSYNGGETKLQIGPRTYVKKNGDQGFAKAGRLTAVEANDLMALMPEILEAMKQ